MDILNIEEIQFLNESEVVSKTLLKWHKAKPGSKELQDVIDAYTKVFLHCTNMQTRAREYEKQLSEMRLAKNRAIQSRNKACDKALELQLKVEEYETIKNLNL